MTKGDRCCGFVHGDFIGTGNQCSRRGIVQRGTSLYCKQHDPEAKAEREKARNAKWQAKWDEQDAIRAEAKRLAGLLGVDGSADYDSIRGRVVRSLVISFEDIGKLIEKLNPVTPAEGIQ